MGWLGFLRGTPAKTVDDIFDSEKGLLAKAGAWYGNREFTAEEQAELNAKTASAVQKFVVDTLSESTDRSRARREIAVFFIKFYTVMLFMCGMTYPVNAEWSQMWFALATSLGVAGLVSAISIFFYGSHALAKYQDKKSG